MTEAGFDPAGFFELDPTHGEARVRGGGRVLVLTDTVVAPLISAAVQNGDLTAVRRLGRHMGEIIRGELAGAETSLSEALPADVVFGYARSVISLFGWGALDVERWGDAIILRLTDSPTLDPDQLAMAALLGGLMSSLAQREVACVPLDTEGAFLMCDPHIAEEVWGWSRAGRSIAEIAQALAPEGAA
jgi:hypothetical protein